MGNRITERDVLDALHRRLCRPADRYGRPPRHVLAEHVADSNHGGRASRTLDAVAVDVWRGTYAHFGDPAVGYGAEGFEIKVSRADLRRELADPTKAGRFTDGCEIYGPPTLTEFTLVAPADVLAGWQELGVPGTWGVMAYQPGARSELRYLRRPTRLRDRLSLGIGDVACLSRAIVRTAGHCVRVHPQWQG